MIEVDLEIPYKESTITMGKNSLSYDKETLENEELTKARSQKEEI
jgi:hypothetical protein